MVNIDPAPSWANIRRLETTDRNMAGPGGILNDPTTSIAARLNLLRDNDTTLGNSIAAVNARQDAADTAIANIQGQVLNAPGTLSDLENGSALDPAAGFPDVPSVENSIGPVAAINESIESLTARTKQLKNDQTSASEALAAPNGSSTVGYRRAGAGAVPRTLEAKARDVPNVKDSGATPGAADSTLAFQAEIASEQRTARLGYESSGYTLGEINLPAGSGIVGPRQLGTQLTLTAGSKITGAFTEISGVRLASADQAFYSLNYVADGFNNFGNLIRDVRFSGLNGIDNGAIETKLYNVYGVGRGTTSVGRGLNITNWDTSAFGVIFQDYGAGIYSNKGVQGCDVHLVRCDVALTLRDQGHPSHISHMYLDTPRTYGAALYAQSYATFTATYVLNVGDTATASTACGFYLDTGGDNNFFGVHFEQADNTKWAGGFRFINNSRNNLLAGISGSYKSANPERFRWQHFFAGHGSWARFNNYTRQNRTKTDVNVAVGAQATLTFLIDYVVPTQTFNTMLFVGSWASRNSSSQGAVGRVWLPIQVGDTGCQPVIEKITGHASIVWSVVSATLSGDTITVVIQNDGTVASTISMELARSVDAMGALF